MSVTAVPIAPTSRRVLAMLWGGLALALIAAVALAFFGTGRAVAQAGSNEQFLEWNAGQTGVQTTASGLQYKVLEAGEGGDLTEREITDRAGLPQPPVEPHDRLAQRHGQLLGCYPLRQRPLHHVS